MSKMRVTVPVVLLLWVAMVKAEPDVKQPKKQTRFADGTGTLLFGGKEEYSGCGIHRDCYSCMAGTHGECLWDSKTGCVASGGLTHGIDATMGVLLCSRDPDAIGETCPQMDNCKQCTETSGCIWNRGACVYSRGDGCLHDPINCANFNYQCPADPSAPDTSPQATSDPADPAAADADADQSLTDLLLLSMLLDGGRGGRGGGGLFGGYRGRHRPAWGGVGTTFTNRAPVSSFASNYFNPQPVQPLPVQPHQIEQNQGPGDGLFGLGHGQVGRHQPAGGVDPFALMMLNAAGIELNDIPGASFFGDRDVGMLNGLVGPSMNIWSATNENPEDDGILGLPAGQHPLCLPGDLFCNSAALDPFAPHNLDPAYEILDNIGVGHQNLQWAEYNSNGYFQPPDYSHDVLVSAVENSPPVRPNGFQPVRPQPTFNPFTTFTQWPRTTTQFNTFNTQTTRLPPTTTTTTTTSNQYTGFMPPQHFSQSNTQPQYNPPQHNPHTMASTSSHASTSTSSHSTTSTGTGAINTNLFGGR